MFYHKIPERRGRRAPGALTLLARVHVCGQLHVIGREEPHLAADFSFPPVGVLLVEDIDDLALVEGQLVVVLGGVIVHPDDLAHCRRQGQVSGCTWAQHRGRATQASIGTRVRLPKKTELSGGAHGLCTDEGLQTDTAAEMHRKA